MNLQSPNWAASNRSQNIQDSTTNYQANQAINQGWDRNVHSQFLGTANPNPKPSGKQINADSIMQHFNMIMQQASQLDTNELIKFHKMFQGRTAYKPGSSMDTSKVASPMDKALYSDSAYVSPPSYSDSLLNLGKK